MDDPVEIAFVGDEPQAAMIQALLEENEIPSLQQQVGPAGPQLGYGIRRSAKKEKEVPNLTRPINCGLPSQIRNWLC